ncbi:phage tail terminator-like protein [Caulobacter sp. SSI4214]|uniref:phage tail terminator-like protein n=1 Tax=Caulobacter sp. SSI4214 TaxID=2575739 RepID=UPI00143C425C|nr:phage tail terminator-like protein [Caulobacter sp. SSI4214]
MSGTPEVAIMTALQAQLRTVDADMYDNRTARENVDFAAPAPTIAYQELTYAWATPGNVEKGASTFLQTGYLQILLRYPGGAGAGAALIRARAIRSAFRCPSSFTADGITTNISQTPQILAGYPDADGRYVVPVRVFFNAQLPN